MNARAKRPFFGWWVVAAGFFIMATCYTAMVNGMSLFQPHIVSDLGITVGDYNTANSLSTLVSIVGALVTGGAVFAISAYLLPDEPEAMVIDPMYLNGIIAGLMAYVLGRSRRGAFICGVLGVLFADVIVAIVNSARGISQTLVLGGAGVFDAAVISGLIGVILAELIGEIAERIVRGSEKPVHSAVRNPVRDKEK